MTPVLYSLGGVAPLSESIVRGIPTVSREHSPNSWSCRGNEFEDEALLDRGDMELKSKNSKAIEDIALSNAQIREISLAGW